ncbi:BCCT family transporter [Salinicoccus roseus]|uniref:BCCT family transporter n=1 Tax=Salinicoccus roseus TaxID=45670 RepID=UPI000F5124F2|nr:BCCT family transporter [Salinicoccus roseus]RPE50917.1 choline-glycine betaine transporter [Salinicoccus roseus]GGA79499.1 transporter [Salinicoccus roseus]
MSNKPKRKEFKTIDWKIFLPSVLFILALSIPFSLYESESLELLNGIFDQIVSSFGWGYIWYATILLAAGLYLSFSKYGQVVLGEPDEKPRFSLFSYASILIAMGLGSTIMRTGMVQWAEVANNPPFGIEPGSGESFLWGNAYAMYMWSFQIFSIFVMTAPAIAYIIHVKKRPMMRISEATRVIFGDRFTDGVGGILIDILFLVSILSGAAVTLGLGTPIITSNLAALLDTEVTFTMTMIVTFIWVALFSLSAYLGIEKGIRRLSLLNMYLAAFLAIFILIVGPGIFIMDFFTDTIGHLLNNYLTYSFFTDSVAVEQTAHMRSHMIFWIAYSATWAMLHSVFAAKISRGRTIKEMILTYLLAPTALSWVATGVLGGIGVHRQKNGELDVLALAQEQEAVQIIPDILQTLPMSGLVMVLYIIMAMIFLTTTLDSTTFTIAAYTSKEDMSEQDPSKFLRIFVAFVITGLALVLMQIGGLAPLEVVSGMMGLPIIILQFLTIYAVKKMIDEDEAWKYNIRKPTSDDVDVYGYKK